MPRLAYPPLVIPFIIIFFILLSLVLLLVQIGIFGIAFTKLGFDPRVILSLLFLSLFGSFVNIPIKRLESERPMISGEIVDFFGMKYVIPVVRRKTATIIAINFGGGIIPLLVSIYLMSKVQHIERVLLAVFILAIMINRMARPVRGVGIAVPALIPPLLAATIAYILSPFEAPAVAYISGTLGSLLGADILNINKVKDLGAPVASIGGAGTFDGIFLTGIIAVLLT
ncbi:MAG: DUF1614 domain-containing protein [Candidatus Hydrothermarchaeota archaeon]